MASASLIAEPTGLQVEAALQPLAGCCADGAAGADRGAACERTLGAERELACQPEPRIAELERRLRQDSSDSGTPASREPIEAKQRRRAERRERSGRPERERRRSVVQGGIHAFQDPEAAEANRAI